MTWISGTSPVHGPGRSRALQTWRAAAGRVASRWQTYLTAGPESRSWAFASYLAALDAEEAAANEIAARSTFIAA